MLLSLVLTRVLALIVLTLIVLARLARLWLVGGSSIRSLAGLAWLLRWILALILARFLSRLLARLLSWILTRILGRSLIGILRTRGIQCPTLRRWYLAVLHVGRRSCLPPVPLLTRRRGLLPGGRGLRVGRVRKNGSQHQPGTQSSG